MPTQEVKANGLDSMSGVNALFIEYSRTMNSPLSGQSVDELPSFEHTPLNARSLEIRLVTLLPGKFLTMLECELDNVVLANIKDAYEALSYVWGDPTPVHAITLNGKRLKIASNLYHALQYLRSEEIPRVLWIDAICINQADTEEKSHQVREMYRVFRDAKRVVSWLGKETEGTERAFAQFKAVAAISEDTSLLAARKRKELFTDLRGHRGTWNAVLDLANRPYWQRGWIVQEITSLISITLSCKGLSEAMVPTAYHPSYNVMCHNRAFDHLAGHFP